MKKTALMLAAVLVLASIMSVSAFAWDYIDLTGTNTVPVVDGKLDDCYQKIHDFYQPNGAEWPDDNDPDHLAKGEAWATWDKDNFYSFFKIYEPDYEPQNGSEEAPTASYSCMYIAYLATPPVDDLPEDEGYVLQFCLNRSTDNTLEWKYTGSVLEEYRDNSADHMMYPGMPPVNFECINDGTYTYYEIVVPWYELDRTGTVKFEPGHQMTFNYIIDFYVADEDAYHYMQYGQGLINDVYDCGGIITLQPAVEEETAAPETEAPAPAAEAAPAPAAEAAPAPAAAAPAAEAAPAAAPVAAAAPAAAAPAVQTGDAAAIAVLAAVAALGTAAVISRKH